MPLPPGRLFISAVVSTLLLLSPMGQRRTIAEPLPASPGSARDLRLPPRIQADYSSFAGEGGGIGRLEGVLPLWQVVGDRVTFLSPRLTLDGDGQVSGGVALGHRFRQGDLLWGGYVGYDLRQTQAGTFHQVGAGFELLADGWDLRLNGYLPVGTRRQQVATTGTSTATITDVFFQGNSLLVQLGGQQISRYQVALGGADLEAGMRLARLGTGGDLWVYGGGYYLTGNGDEGTLGGRLRLAARPVDGLTLGLGVQTDARFGSRALLTLAASLPGRSTGGAAAEEPPPLWTRAGEFLVRNATIWVEEQTEVTGTAPRLEVAVNPETGTAYVFRHVVPNANNPNQGDGTVETPFTTLGSAADAATTGLGAAQPGDVVYLRPGDSATTALPPFTIPAGVQVRSTGPVQTLTVDTSLGSIPLRLPESGAGQWPQIDGGGGPFGVRMIGGNNRLDGVEIRNAVAGLQIQGGSAAIARNNWISQTQTSIAVTDTAEAPRLEANRLSQTDAGITLAPGVTAAVISDNQISQTQGSALLIQGDDALVRGNTLSAVTFGIVVRQADTVMIQGNTLTDVSTDVLAEIPAAITVADVTGNIRIEDNILTNITGSQPDATNLNAWALEAAGISVSQTRTTADQLDVVISGNTIQDTTPLAGSPNRSGDGIVVGFVNPAAGQRANPTARVAITDNTIQSVGSQDGGDRRGDGIKIGLEEDSRITTLTLTNNVITAPVDEGVDISLGLAELLPGVEPSSARIDRATIQNNTIADSGGRGIESRVLGANSRAAIAAADNTLTDTAGPGFAAIVGDTDGGDRSTLCLALTGNRSLTGYDLSAEPPFGQPFAGVFFGVDLPALSAGSLNTGPVTLRPNVSAFTNLTALSACPL